MSSPGTSRRIGFFGKLMKAVIPARTRRVIALSSLYALLLGKQPTLQQLTALNNSLNLAKYPEGLQAPSRIPEVIWKNAEDITVSVDITDKETTIMSRLSPWLVYGGKLDIASDVRLLLQFVEMRRSGVAVAHTSNLKIVASSSH